MIFLGFFLLSFVVTFAIARDGKSVFELWIPIWMAFLSAYVMVGAFMGRLW